MRALGIDLGTKKIGIALTDSLKMFASGFDTFEVIKNDYEDFIEYLKNMFERYRNDFDVIVLGYPTHMNGDKTP
jgi:putative Holliday junction resolvase